MLDYKQQAINKLNEMKSLFFVKFLDILGSVQTERFYAVSAEAAKEEIELHGDCAKVLYVYGYDV